MAKIISVHSFRGGTGKSNTTANLSVLLAAFGLRVGVIDTDIQSPGIHILFGFDHEKIKYALNDYLWGDCPIHEAAYDVTQNLSRPINGQIFLIPSSIKADDIARVLQEGFEPRQLISGLRQAIDELNLDVLMIDTHPGLNAETLLSIAISHALVIILRPDAQDYQGTAVTVQVSRKLDVQKIFIIVNKVPQFLNFDEIKQKVERIYGCEVAAILPMADEMLALASEGILALRYPDHQITKKLLHVSKRLISDD